jgi:hypothetical protein
MILRQTLKSLKSILFTAYKSRVIEAISDYMRFLGRAHTLRKLAPSSAAAVGINGLTIQSMLHERRQKPANNMQTTQLDVSAIEREWNGIDYCLIDEVSIVGCYMLARIHKIMTIAKHTEPTTPFGGINMLFLGDFVQYAPVLDRPLYCNLLSPNENSMNTINRGHFTRPMTSERDIQCRIGRALWLQINRVFFLIEQMRNKDSQFVNIQSRLRIEECTDVSG